MAESPTMALVIIRTGTLRAALAADAIVRIDPWQAQQGSGDDRIDLGLLLGGQASAPGPAARVLRSRHAPVGLVVDAIETVVEISDRAFLRIPDYLMCRCALPCLRGMVKLPDGALVALIDVRRLTHPPGQDMDSGAAGAAGETR